MDLTRYVEDLRQQLLVAADAGGDDARAVAERLVVPLQSSTRLVLLEAITAAAAEITSDLAPGSVEVRLRGRDPEFVVVAPPTDAPPLDHDLDGAFDQGAGVGAGAAPEPAGEADEASTSRMTLRLPEPLKVRIEDAAGRDGLSVNAWLVRTLTGALDAPARSGRPLRRSATGGDRFTGWTRS